VKQNEASQKGIINYRIHILLLGACHHSVNYTITHKTYTQEGTSKHREVQTVNYTEYSSLVNLTHKCKGKGKAIPVTGC
jgi:hypothetical protein